MVPGAGRIESIWGATAEAPHFHIRPKETTDPMNRTIQRYGA
jgi:hypothetical protein